MMDTNSSDQGEEMRRKAAELLRRAKAVANQPEAWIVVHGVRRIELLEDREKELFALADLVEEVLPLLCEQVEKLSELCTELFIQKTELQLLSRDLAASLRSNPNVTNS